MINCLIVDDEPIARRLLEKYVGKTPMLELIGSIDNALEILSFLSQRQVDLLFLDINMPEFSGIDLLKSMRNPPKVIITTAYAEYGAESYEYNVIDYLMKPISFERFVKAVQKALPTYQNEPISETEQTTNHHTDFIFLKEDQKVHKILIKDIQYLQAYGNYVKVFRKDQVIIVRKTLSELEEELGQTLYRLHKSYLVSPNFIKRVEDNKVVMNNDQILPIGKMYKHSFVKRLG